MFLLFVGFFQGLCFDFNGQAKIGLFYFFQKRFDGWNRSVQFCFDDYADCFCKSYAESFRNFLGFIVVLNHYAVRCFESQCDCARFTFVNLQFQKPLSVFIRHLCNFHPFGKRLTEFGGNFRRCDDLPVNFMKQFEFADIRQNNKTTRARK